MHRSGSSAATPLASNLEDFAADARAWLVANIAGFDTGSDPTSPTLVFPDVTDTRAVIKAREWQALMQRHGWAGLAWPARFGGRGASLAHRVIWARESAAVGAPLGLSLLSEGVIGPTLMTHGGPDQHRRFLGPMLSGKHAWCQLLSEAGAGSDLASVGTVAVPKSEGGRWVVNGHKVWTSAAHYADFALLLARTDTKASKHAGLTCFIVDMSQSGIEVQPLRQMTGGAAFNQVWLGDVEVDDRDRLGPVGGGWPVAMTMLGHERLALGLGAARVGGGVTRILERFSSSPAVTDPAARQKAAQLWIEARSLAALGERDLRRLETGGEPGPEGAVLKLASARVSRRCDEVLDFTRGAGATLWDADSLVQLWIPATSIAGGTDEVMRTVVAERVLGLPRPSTRPEIDIDPSKDQHARLATSGGAEQAT
ncbi:MAG: acyl-CoA dehydrogenase family protein [Acidimicrobiales bacterium]